MSRHTRLARATAIVGSLLGGLLVAGCKDEVGPAAPITVTAVSPTSDLLGGGSSVTITGTNFIDVTSVTIDGRELGSRTLVSTTEITGTIPAAANPGTTDVVVTSSSHGRGTCRGCFSYMSLVLQTQPLAAGDYHTCALNSSGAAYCWGHIDPLTDIITVTVIPVAVSGGWSFSAIVASGFHTCGLTSSGAAYCWGANHAGQLGNGSTTSSAAPVAVSGGLSFSALATGGTRQPIPGPPAFIALAHTCGLTRAGATYCWGDNSYGQLGVASTTRSATPVAVSGGLSFRALAAGTAYTCALTSTGAAYCWGAGYGTAPVAVSGGLSFSALAAGGNHTCGLTSAGAAYCWGDNTWGQLGDGSTTSSAAPVAVSGGLSFSALAAGGSVLNIWYRGLHTCGLTSAGAAYCWGANSSGQLGNGSTTASAVPIAVSGGLTFNAVVTGGAHTCGLTSAGARHCWGDNDAGQLGDGSLQTWWAPAPVSGLAHATLLAAGYRHTCALVSSPGAAYCWGTGALGDGSTTGSAVPVAVSGGLSFVALTAHTYHACGLTNPGAAYCWGDNSSGQLGDGSTTGSAVPVAVSGGLSFGALVAGGAHTCGLIGGGTAYCWGFNYNGQLGTGSTTGSTTPVAVSGGLSFGALVTGRAHTCGLIGGGAAYCWGANYNGQLGTGSTTGSATPVAVSGGLSFSALAAGGGDSECGVTNAGAAYCWGENHAGQLGDGSTTNSLIPVAVSGGLSFSALTAGVTNSGVIGHTCGLTTAGAAYCWGDNDWGQLGDGSTTGSALPVAVSGGLSFISLAAGSFHTCGVSSAGAPYCWGDNRLGQLGRGTFAYSTVPVAVAPF